MTEQQQRADTDAQLAYMDQQAWYHGYGTIADLFLDEPELFDRIAAEFRENNPQ